MSKLNFKLRNGSDESSTIILHFHYGKGNRLRYSTRYKLINSKNWNEDKQRIKNVVQEINKLAINNKLNEIQTFINKLYINLREDQKKDVTNRILINELNNFLNRGSKENVSDEESRFLQFLPFFDWYLEYHKTNPLPNTKKPMRKGTLRTYRNSYNILKRFNDGEYHLSYEKITLDFYIDFLNYLNNRNLSTNYIGTQIKILKTIMNAAYEKDFHSNMDYKKRHFVKPVENTDDIYLNELEILKLHNIDLSNIKKERVSNSLVMKREQLETARDLFLIGANTGLRISDFTKLTSKNIEKRKNRFFFNVTTQKTGSLISIPINPMVLAILKKRNGTPPKRIPDQHLNYAIKFLGKLAKINSIESKTITRGGKTIIKNIEKYKLISSHTARRSFCTNAYKSGMPTIDIMAISGHKTERIFYGYIKVSPEERAEKIAKHEFFNNNNLKIVRS